MSALPAILSRIQAEKPVLLGCDPMASLQQIGAALDGHAPIGRLLREDPAKVAEHHRREVEAGADGLLALTSDTMPRALAHAGMAFRAAALTRCAVELALEAASDAGRPIAVAGVLGNPWIESIIAERIAEEHTMHAARLAASGCELIVANGFGRAASSPVNLARLARVAAVVSAKATRLPTWAMIELHAADRTPDGEPIEDCVGTVVDSGAEVLLLDVPSVEVASLAMKRVASAFRGAKMGVLLRALSAGADGPDAATAWAKDATSLIGEGARILGGGRGTTTAHLAALAAALRGRAADV